MKAAHAGTARSAKRSSGVANIVDNISIMLEDFFRAAHAGRVER
jgi:hypothetical protein